MNEKCLIPEHLLCDYCGYLQKCNAPEKVMLYQFSLSPDLIRRHGKIEFIAIITGIPHERLEEILSCKERPDGKEIVVLCHAAGVDPFTYGLQQGQDDFDRWVEKNHGAE